MKSQRGGKIWHEEESMSFKSYYELLALQTGSSSMVTLLPDTQELCRRLEEKIDSLTRMGGNLVKENQGK